MLKVRKKRDAESL